jgi:hypothetical protein
VALLPDSVPAWLAHWVGAELVARSGMTLAAGACELFPSRLDYSDSSNPADWAQSHGVRLPGQEGSALLVGTGTASDTLLIYEELLAQLEATRSRQKAEQAPRASHRPRHPSRRSHGIRWTAAGQSNGLLGRITTWARLAHPEARTVAELAPIIAAAASSAPGFTEHASELSQQDLEHWAERWARFSLRKNRAPRSPEVSSDKHHNRRLFLQSRAVLTKLWRSMGSAAASFSQRFVADQTGLNRKTLRRHWDYWLQLVAGPHPSLTGGGDSFGCPLW